METININIDNIEFQLNSMGTLTAAILDRKIIAILAPTAAGLLEDGVDSELNLNAVLGNLGSGLLTLNDVEFKKLLTDMFFKVVAIVPGEPPLQLNTEINIDKVFTNVLSIYKLMYEVMRFNGFSIFQLVGGGLEINKILSSIMPKEKTVKSQNKSEKSGS